MADWDFRTLLMNLDSLGTVIQPMITILVGASLLQDLPSQSIRLLEPPAKPKLLILGLYHFANPGLDVVKAELDDHLSSKRQREIVTLNRALSAFGPTKIAVESPFGSTEIQRKFQSWVEGTVSLSANETEQIGFRLAKKFNHKQIYPIDHKLDMDFDTFLKESNPKVIKQFEAATGEAQKMMTSLKDHSVIENLRLLNSPQADRFSNGLYLRLLQSVSVGKHPGANLVSSWWTRNLYWISNISTVASEPTDRVILLCGSSHAATLRSILKDSLDFEIVDPNPLLKG